jgi:hypothetical protein
MKAAVKRAAAYLRSGKIYLYPYSRTIKGFWIGCEPILVTSEADKSLGLSFRTFLRLIERGFGA